MPDSRGYQHLDGHVLNRARAHRELFCLFSLFLGLLGPGWTQWFVCCFFLSDNPDIGAHVHDAICSRTTATAQELDNSGIAIW